MHLEQLTRIDLRSVWENETTGFSSWLSRSENLQLLGSEIGIKLELIKRESLAGKFRVDILAKNSNNNDIVIIENQIEETDHSHLGKIITYSSHYNTKVIIWVVRDLRIEHEKAIEWLNANIGNGIKIFLVKIELFKIGNSGPAPKFTVLSKPYGWTNKLFRKEVEIEPFPNEIIQIEKLKKRIARSTLIQFLDSYIELETKYPKLQIFNAYAQKYPKDGEYYRIHKMQFKMDLHVWAQMKDFIVNKDYQNEKSKGNYKSGGVEYIIVSDKDN
jgi:hypothetical protein